jgi:hypothetical protein
VTVFPGEIYRAPRSWAERSYHKLIYWNEVDKGGLRRVGAARTRQYRNPSSIQIAALAQERCPYPHARRGNIDWTSKAQSSRSCHRSRRVVDRRGPPPFASLPPNFFAMQEGSRFRLPSIGAWRMARPETPMIWVNTERSSRGPCETAGLPTRTHRRHPSCGRARFSFARSWPGSA